LKNLFDFGFEVQWEGEMGGELLETVVGLRDGKHLLS
jgi:hypothetical protein